MRKHHGTLIHRSKDCIGTIEIVDDGYTRSLYFGNATRQSAADLSRPGYLVLTYTRAMMSSLLFQSSPRKVLLIGLGGGSLAKFLLCHFPKCSVDAIECREQIVHLAHSYFELPEDPRLQIHIADGVDFVQSAAAKSSNQYDLILIDAYHDTGMDDNMGDQRFLQACQTLMTKNGLLTINLWARDRPSYLRTRQSLHRCFGTKPLLLPAEGTTNVIALAFNQAVHSDPLKTIETHTKPLEELTGLELRKFSRMLRKQNTPLLHRFFQ